MMNSDQTHLHNIFLLCLFNKCSGLSKATSKTKLKDFKKLKLNKAKRSSDKSSFQVCIVLIKIFVLHLFPVNY